MRRTGVTHREGCDGNWYRRTITGGRERCHPVDCPRCAALAKLEQSGVWDEADLPILERMNASPFHFKED